MKKRKFKIFMRNMHRNFLRIPYGLMTEITYEMWRDEAYRI
jgi:hypothetical protein